MPRRPDNDKVVPTFEKYFTLEEATALLPFVRETFAQIEQVQTELARRAPEISRVLEAADGNGGGQKASAYLETVVVLRDLVRKLTDRGILVKNIGAGLVDFPHLRDGREVFLCYKVGEEGIAFWHEMDAGFAGRQSI